MRAALRLLLSIILITYLSPSSTRAQVEPSGPSRAESRDAANPLVGWSPFWARSEGAGTAVVDPAVRREGRDTIRVEQKGPRDWSLSREQTIEVKPGQIHRLSAWFKVAEGSRAVLSVVLRDEGDRVLEWSYGERIAVAPEWDRVEARFMIPPGAKTMQPRVIGDGPARFWIDDLSLTLDPDSLVIGAKPSTESLELADARLRVVVDPTNGAFRVRDARSGREWSQPSNGSGLVILGAKRESNQILIDFVDPRSIMKFRASVRIDPDPSEIVVELTGQGPLASPIAFPYPFVTGDGTTLILPVNEGMSYPVDDPSLPPMEFILYGGHGLCMAWWGVVDGQAGLMAIVETPDDASVRVPRSEGKLCLAPLWEPQKGRFGPTRRIRYIFFEDGGYVAMAKRYREYARSTGLLKTLVQKRAENPNIDKLVGAANIWCWDRDPVAIVRELKEAGIDRILWSNAATPEQLRKLNQLGVLTSRYDIDQDVMDPATFPRLPDVHPDWTTKAWPEDLMLDARGNWIRGWEVEGKDGRMYACGVTCDRQAVSYAVKRIGEELRTHPYQSRFIDTTTASPWRECYSPTHPVTRSESRRFKMDLLGVVHDRYKLITGSETGHDAAVPFADYFEGMLSLGPYRVADAGRDMARIVKEVPPQIEKFQTGAYYRLPLWELVFHDCVVAHWYWGDYNNKLPAVWARRDLFNALYGTPPMFMFTADSWRRDRDRFVESYRTATRVARESGYSEMLSHEWLTPDHSVQRTRFADGQVVVVNFGDQPYRTSEADLVSPLGVLIHSRGETP
ncbi:glycoside hydrolase [Planctomyces sp. SH-PL62]|uniref:glycoside hydrolase n=1 Tax=Planctomyces sp. SH-PL62 TaxID=1636152 RepID=UPI00078BD32B|nr:glycoside hydrolase [Planctomyces sp. SH-PL62]AMV39122.1 Carbohydrate binding domain protein [Planctomyces sp. SH-PL62]